MSTWSQQSCRHPPNWHWHFLWAAASSCLAVLVACSTSIAVTALFMPRAQCFVLFLCLALSCSLVRRWQWFKHSRKAFACYNRGSLILDSLSHTARSSQRRGVSTKSSMYNYNWNYICAVSWIQMQLQYSDELQSNSFFYFEYCRTRTWLLKKLQTASFWFNSRAFWRLTLQSCWRGTLHRRQFCEATLKKNAHRAWGFGLQLRSCAQRDWCF